MSSPALLARVRRALPACLAVLAAAPAAAAADTPSAGAPGAGDEIFPTLGNGGYDVKHYALSLRYAEGGQPEAGTAAIVSRATQSLSSFNLDYDRGTVGSVTVNGRRAAFSQDGEELVVTPSRSLRRGSTFVTVVDYAPDPLTPLDGESYTNVGWSLAAESSIVWAQPNATHDVYPSNDHPSDKASFSFHLDVPAGTTAIANGARLWERTSRGRTRSHYLMSKPMATELTQIAVGSYERSSLGRHRGVHIRNATEPAVADVANPAFARIPEHLDWAEETLGLKYPFEQYGGIVFDAPVPGAVETQTISSYGSFWFDYPLPLWDEVFVHELAHEWFGNSVTPSRWKDVWLNESHATYYEHLYGEPRGGLEAWYGIPTRDELYAVVHELQPEWRAEFGPPGAPKVEDEDVFALFNSNIYEGGALVLYALHKEIGARAFAKLEREWALRNKYGNVTTDDYIDLASEVARRDMRPFLEAWIYGEEAPPLPGAEATRMSAAEAQQVEAGSRQHARLLHGHERR
jgi:aminopeptidase N